MNIRPILLTIVLILSFNSSYTAYMAQPNNEPLIAVINGTIATFNNASPSTALSNLDRIQKANTDLKKVLDAVNSFIYPSPNVSGTIDTATRQAMIDLLQKYAQLLQERANNPMPRDTMSKWVPPYIELEREVQAKQKVLSAQGKNLFTEIDRFNTTIIEQLPSFALPHPTTQALITAVISMLTPRQTFTDRRMMPQ